MASAAAARIDGADSNEELDEALGPVATSWRARAQDLLVQARLGSMELDDALSTASVRFQTAGDHLTELIAGLRDEDAEWSAEIRSRARVVVDDVRSAVEALLTAARK